MKKLTCILTAIILLCMTAFAASADSLPQAEGGKKFESDWAIPGGNAEIVYEDQGYRIAIDILNKEEETGSEWEYSCYYHEDTDCLMSVASSRKTYIRDPYTNERTYAESTYDGFDDENQATVFTIDKDGFLIWKDGREDAGAGLKFTDIGLFDGQWKNEAEETEAEFQWNGFLYSDMSYTVFITRGKTDAERYTIFTMKGTYDPAAGKLTAEGTCTLYTKNASGGYDESNDGETYDAIFSMTKDGKVLYETDNGIELEYNDAETAS